MRIFPITLDSVMNAMMAWCLMPDHYHLVVRAGELPLWRNMRLPYALVGLVAVLSALPVALFWFEVPLRGSFVTLVVLTLPFMLCSLALGLLISTLSHTQQQAMMLTTFVFIMPQIYLSGFAFPIQNMPHVFQLATYLIPLRY